MANFAVTHTWGLQRGRPRSKCDFALALIFKGDPPLKDIDHLKIQIMDVPCGLCVAARYGADDICAVVAFCGAVYT